MLNKIALGLILGLLMVSHAFAEESITLSTYYPSPYGSYNNLTVANNLDVNSTLSMRGIAAAPAVSASGQGRIYFDSSTNKFMTSENGSAYANLGGGSPVYVGATTITYNGNLGGYTGGDAKCALSFSGSRMCSSGNFINGRPTVSGWYSVYYNSGAWGDCLGWTSSDVGYLGMAWYLTSPQAQATTCNFSKPILCCK
ncbi:MAG: hypothetical protein ABIH27_01745 [Candidatus Omnitrophota bacterium]